MNEETREFLKNARAFLLDEKPDEEKAFLQYGEIMKRSAVCPEAMWFIGYFLAKRDYEKIEDAPNDLTMYAEYKAFLSLAEDSFGERFYEMLESIMSDSDVDDEDKMRLVMNMTLCYNKLAMSIFRWGRDQQIAIEHLRPVGYKILEICGNDRFYTIVAAGLWKNIIYMRHCYCAYRNFRDKNKETWYDKMIKDIQKYDSDYAAPQFKQAGCLMFGESAKEATKVLPGE